MIAKFFSTMRNITYLHFSFLDWISVERPVRSTSVIASTGATSVFAVKRMSGKLNGLLGDELDNQNR